MRLALLLILALTGCAIYLGPSAEDIKANEACKARTSVVEKAKCMNEVENAYLRGKYAYPDLLNLRHSYRIALAEKIERGEIPLRDADVQFDAVMVQIKSEEANRTNANAMLAAQNSAAMLNLGAALMQVNQPIRSGFVTCTRAGPTATCVY